MRLVLLATIFVATAVHAEPARYVQTDLMVGGTAPDVGPNLLAGLAVGVRVAPNLWARGELAGGPAADDQGGGTASQLRAGIEARGCTTTGVACAIAGADLGGQRGTWTSHDMMENETLDALVVIPRVGVDAGGRTWRGRLGLEIDESLYGRHFSSYAPADTRTGAIGFELAAGVAYQW